MKVKSISIKNIKAIDEKVVEFNGCTAIITWWNNKWKSTLLRSLPDRIRGLKPDQIVKIWETDWRVEWKLTDWSTIVRTVTEEWKEKFSYILENGLEIKDSVISFLQSKYFGEWFDIDKFLLATPKTQKDMVQKLIGKWFDEIDAEYKEAFSFRAEKNSILKNEKAKVTESDFAEGPVELKDIKTIQALITDWNERNQDYNLLDQKSVWLQASIDRNKKEIERLQNEIALLEGQKNGVDEKLKSTEKVDVVKLEAELNEAIQFNQKASEHNNSLKQFDVIKQAEAEAKEADEKLQEIEARRQELRKEANLPEWFTFEDEGILYNGLPLNKEQLSSSSVYIASLKLASMKLWALQTLVFDASFLDRKSLEEVEKRAEANWYQLLIERPDFDGWEIEYQLIQD